MEKLPTKKIVWTPSHVAPLITVSGSGNETSIEAGFALDESGTHLLGLPKFKLDDGILPDGKDGRIASACCSSSNMSGGGYTEMTLTRPKPGSSLGMYRVGDVINRHPTLSARTIVDAIRYRSTPDLRRLDPWEQIVDRCCTRLEDGLYLVTVQQGGSLDSMIVSLGSLRVAAVFGAHVVNEWGTLRERECIGTIEQIAAELPGVAAQIDTALAMLQPR